MNERALRENQAGLSELGSGGWRDFRRSFNSVKISRADMETTLLLAHPHTGFSDLLTALNQATPYEAMRWRHFFTAKSKNKIIQHFRCDLNKPWRNIAQSSEGKSISELICPLFVQHLTANTFFNGCSYRGRMHDKEMAGTTRTRIIPQTHIFCCGPSIMHMWLQSQNILCSFFKQLIENTYVVHITNTWIF